MFDRKDHYYKKAKKEGQASRAAYKIIEIQEKYKLAKKGDKILELGCSPGGWLKILSQTVGPQGLVIGVDLLPLQISISPNVLFLQEDFYNPTLIAEIEQLSPRFDLIVSDISPNLSGITFRDTHLSLEMALHVWQLAKKLLKNKGHLLIKIFPSSEANELKSELKKAFAKFDIFIPKATRKGSAEVYFIALGFKG